MDKSTILNYLEKNKHFLSSQYNISRIGLYGSFVRGTQSEKSDIDLVYETAKGQRLSYRQFLDLLEKFQQEFGRPVELVNYRFMNPIIKYKANKEVVYV